MSISGVKNLLKSTKMEISEIAFEVGFNNVTYFHRIFKKRYKTTPQAFRQEIFKNR